MPLPDEAGAALIRRHQSAVAGITNRTASRLGAIWDTLPGYDKADIGGFAARAANISDGAVRAARDAGVGFYSTLMGVSPPSIDQAAVAIAPDVRKAFTAHWHALSQGRPYEEAVAAGRSALEAEVDHAVVSTARRTGDHVARASGQKVMGWHRALSSGACRWCQQVAGQTYKSSDSADFGHARCHCTPVPVTTENNPAAIVNDRETATTEARGVAPAKAISQLPGGAVGKAAREALDQIAKVHRIPEGMTAIPVGTSTGSAKGVYTFKFATPSRIRVRASGDHLTGTFTHEFGHYLDHQADLVAQAIEGRPVWGSSPHGRRRPLMSAFFKAVDASPTMQALTKLAGGPQASLTGAKVATTRAEVWARAYHQWIATRSGSQTMKAEITAIRAKGEVSVLMQWDDVEFESIAEALDAIFQDAGLLA